MWLEVCNYQVSSRRTTHSLCVDKQDEAIDVFTYLPVDNSLKFLGQGEDVAVFRCVKSVFCRRVCYGRYVWERWGCELGSDGPCFLHEVGCNVLALQSWGKRTFSQHQQGEDISFWWTSGESNCQVLRWPSEESNAFPLCLGAMGHVLQNDVARAMSPERGWPERCRQSDVARAMWPERYLISTWSQWVPCGAGKGFFALMTKTHCEAGSRGRTQRTQNSSTSKKKPASFFPSRIRTLYKSWSTF